MFIVNLYCYISIRHHFLHRSYCSLGSGTKYSTTYRKPVHWTACLSLQRLQARMRVCAILPTTPKVASKWHVIHRHYFASPSAAISSDMVAQLSRCTIEMNKALKPSSGASQYQWNTRHQPCERHTTKGSNFTPLPTRGWSATAQTKDVACCKVIRCLCHSH